MNRWIRWIQAGNRRATDQGSLIRVVQVHRRWITGLATLGDTTTPPCSPL
jgi:hypothetical protein